jgi:hypothetical protein
MMAEIVRITPKPNQAARSGDGDAHVSVMAADKKSLCLPKLHRQKNLKIL